MRNPLVLGSLLFATLAVGPAIAQDKPALERHSFSISPDGPQSGIGAAVPTQDSTPSAHRKIPAPIPLKVTVVLSRYQGEKRVSSMPYSMGVMASGYGSAPKTTLRMGVDVPVTTT